MPDFDGAGQAPGVEIWRVEKADAVRKDFDGSFCTGDTYVVLQTSAGAPLQWDIYFWQGADSDPTEKGMAQVKTDELDTLLGGKPDQHRQVQGHESEEFMALFANCGGVRYEAGGVDALNAAGADGFTNRFYRLKGKKNPRAVQMPPMAKLMNHGDVYVYDTKCQVFAWVGSSANRDEKRVGVALAERITSSRTAASLFIVEDKPRVDMNEEEYDSFDDFWKLLEGEHVDVGEADGQDEVKKAIPNRIFKITDDVDGDGEQDDEDGDGEVDVQAVLLQEAIYLDQGLLCMDDIFMVDTNDEVFVWAGPLASREEKMGAMKVAQGHLAQEDRPDYISVSRFSASKETMNFKAAFKRWDDKFKYIERSWDPESKKSSAQVVPPKSAAAQPQPKPKPAAPPRTLARQTNQAGGTVGADQEGAVCAKCAEYRERIEALENEMTTRAATEADHVAEGEIARLNRMGEELLRQRREFEAELARQRAQSQADIEELRAQLEAAKYAASRAGERSPQEELASSRRELAGAGLGMTVVSTPCTTCAQWGAHSAAADERIRELERENNLLHSQALEMRAKYLRKDYISSRMGGASTRLSYSPKHSASRYQAKSSYSPLLERNTGGASPRRTVSATSNVSAFSPRPRGTAAGVTSSMAYSRTTSRASPR